MSQLQLQYKSKQCDYINYQNNVYKFKQYLNNYIQRAIQINKNENCQNFKTF